MEFEKAKVIACKYLQLLKPFCLRIEIAGSIRRQKANPKDIELVAIPQKRPSDLFGDEYQACPEFVKVVNSWRKIKGEPNGKYTQRALPEGINLDLFVASPENWGLIFAIRTGSAEFSHRILATTWAIKGFKSINGTLYKNNLPIQIREEIDLFSL